MNTTIYNTRKPVRMVFAAVAMFATLATAAQADEAFKVAVNYADLNVNTAAGAAVLYQRSRHAADQVCGTADGRNLAEVARVEACTQRAIEKALVEAGVAKLTAQYDAKTGIHQNRIELAAR